MKKELMRLMEKKKGKELDSVEQEARLNVLDDLRKVAMDEMGERLKGLKKITVAAEDKEGLKQGLEKAEEILENEEVDHEMHEAMESPEEEAMEHAMGEESSEDEEDEDSLEMLKAKIAELQAKVDRLNK